MHRPLKSKISYMVMVTASENLTRGIGSNLIKRKIINNFFFNKHLLVNTEIWKLIPRLLQQETVNNVV
jgi:hypothetical protein